MASFLWYAVKRFLLVIPFLIGITLLSFLLGLIAPGDPAIAVLTMDGSTEPTAEQIEAMRRAMGLDQPVWTQYMSWLSHTAVGDLGTSYLTQRSVLSEILRRFPVTLELAVWAMGWILLLGIPGGLWAARHKDTAPEWMLRGLSLVMISVPGFWLAILCMLIFSEELRLLPSSGYGSPMQMVMPSFVLAAGTAAAVIRLLQTSVLEVMEKPFITSERAKGLPMPLIMRRHVLPNAMMPVITLLGTFFGAVLGGSVIIEDMFSLPGMGSYVLAAIWGRDYPVIQGYVVVSGFIFITFNYLVDLSYYVLNPALRGEK